MNKDEWIRSFPKNCDRIKERAKKGCKDAQNFLDELKRCDDRFDMSYWAERAHIAAALFAVKDFAAAFKDWGKACDSGDSDAAESALSRMMNENPEELNAFADIIEETTGKPSVIRSIIPLISDNGNNPSAKKKQMNPVCSHEAAVLKGSNPQRDIAALKKDAAIVAEAFGRARRLAEAMDSDNEKEILLAAKEFENADDDDAISRLSKFADKEEFTDEELAVLRELCKTADIEHLNLNPLLEEDENDKREKRVTKEKKKGKSDVQIYTYAEWRDSWHKEREED